MERFFFFASDVLYFEAQQPIHYKATVNLLKSFIYCLCLRIYIDGILILLLHPLMRFKQKPLNDYETCKLFLYVATSFFIFIPCSFVAFVCLLLSTINF